MKNAPFKISPDERIQMIRISLRSLGFGKASAIFTLAMPIAAFLVLNVDKSFRSLMMLATIWIPFGSLLFAVHSWRTLFKAKKIAQGEWNPAAPQLLWGRIFSAFAVLISLLLIGFFACVYVDE